MTAGMHQSYETPRGELRRDEDKTTHDLVIEVLRGHRALSESLNEHIMEEPKTLQRAIDGAIDRLVPNGDSQGHKLYHEQVISAVRAKQLASEAEEQFWLGLKQDAMKGGILGLLKVTLICLGMYLAYRIGYKGPMPW